MDGREDPARSFDRKSDAEKYVTTVEAEALAPIAARLAAERAKTDAETAATRVNFFTLVRGEDSA